MRIALALALIVGSPISLRAQTPDSAAAAEQRARRIAERRQRDSLERRAFLDSIAAGRRRWAQSGVTTYVIHTHVNCFCISNDSAPPPALLTVRNGRVLAQAPGKDGWVNGKPNWTVDTLFDRVEADVGGATEKWLESVVERPGLAQQYQRKVQRLELHPRYGFPLIYRAETPAIPDLWLEIRVDTFTVLRKTTRKAK
jgi:hypothetical protein